MLARLRKKTEDNEGGFTLIELLVVIIIIGILAAIAIPVFLNQRKKGVDAGIKSDLRQAANEMESYFTDSQRYPTSAELVASPPAIKISKSSGNVILAKASSAGGQEGFCLQGYNTKATANSATNSYWYDSTLGGLKGTAGTASAAGATGSCGTAPASTDVVAG